MLAEPEILSMKLSLNKFPNGIAKELGRLKDDEKLRKQTGQHPWLATVAAAGIFPGFAGMAASMAFGWPSPKYYLPMLFCGFALGSIHTMLLQHLHRGSKEELRWSLPLYLLEHLPLRKSQKMSLMVDFQRLEKGSLRWLETNLTLNDGRVIRLHIDRHADRSSEWVPVRAGKLRLIRAINFYDRVSIQGNTPTRWSAERQDLLTRQLAELKWNLIQVNDDGADGNFRVEVTSANCRYEIIYAQPDGEFDLETYLKAMQLLLEIYTKVEVVPPGVKSMPQPSALVDSESPFEFEDSTV